MVIKQVGWVAALDLLWKFLWLSNDIMNPNSTQLQLHVGSEFTHGESSEAICHHRSPVKMAIESTKVVGHANEPWEEFSGAWESQFEALGPRSGCRNS